MSLESNSLIKQGLEVIKNENLDLLIHGSMNRNNFSLKSKVLAHCCGNALAVASNVAVYAGVCYGLNSPSEVENIIALGSTFIFNYFLTDYIWLTGSVIGAGLGFASEDYDKLEDF